MSNRLLFQIEEEEEDDSPSVPHESFADHEIDVENAANKARKQIVVKSFFAPLPKPVDEQSDNIITKPIVLSPAVVVKPVVVSRIRFEKKEPPKHTSKNHFKVSDDEIAELRRTSEKKALAIADAEKKAAFEIKKKVEAQQKEKLVVEKHKDANSGVYQGDLTNNVKHGHGAMRYKNGNVYTGEWAFGKREGQGKLVYSTANSFNPPKGSNGGDIYEGGFHDDKCTGQGKYTFINGDYYIGGFKNNAYNGFGESFMTSCKSTYKGYFLDDLYHGHGVMHYANGDVYKGEWKNGWRHGTGSLTNKDGKVLYSGEWRNNFDSKAKPLAKTSKPIAAAKSAERAHVAQVINSTTDKTEKTAAEKKQERENKRKYKPSDLNHNFNLFFSNTSSLHGDGEYTGERKDGKRKGKRHGNGTMEYLSGNKYTGEWVDGKMHGQGRYEFTQQSSCDPTIQGGDMYVGGFENDHIAGYGVYRDNAGDVYEGQMKDGMSHGHGKFTSQNGTSYEGNYAFDCRSGQGVMRYRDGHVYDGEWVNDKRQGWGILTLGDKIEHTGWWHEDKPSATKVTVKTLPRVKNYNPVFADQYEDEVDLKATPNKKAKRSKRERDEERDAPRQPNSHSSSSGSKPRGRPALLSREQFLSGDYTRETWEQEGEESDEEGESSEEESEGESDGSEVSEDDGDYAPAKKARKEKNQQKSSAAAATGNKKPRRDSGPIIPTTGDANTSIIETLSPLKAPQMPPSEVFDAEIVTINYPNGDSYKGQLSATGQRHGRGELKYRNGNIYHGDWRNDMKTYGLMQFSNANSCDSRFPGGDIYIGQWENDTMHGWGKLTHNYLDVYEGEFANGKGNGVGRFTAKTGSVYDGSFANDLRNGEGTMYYLDGHVYTGAWVNQKREGYGVLRKGARIVHDGYWRNDKNISEHTARMWGLVPGSVATNTMPAGGGGRGRPPKSLTTVTADGSSSSTLLVADTTDVSASLPVVAGSGELAVNTDSNMGSETDSTAGNTVAGQSAFPTNSTATRADTSLSTSTASRNDPPATTRAPWIIV